MYTLFSSLNTVDQVWIMKTPITFFVLYLNCCCCLWKLKNSTGILFYEMSLACILSLWRMWPEQDWGVRQDCWRNRAEERWGSLAVQYSLPTEIEVWRGFQRSFIKSVSRCGATIIQQYADGLILLTAAHCVHDIDSPERSLSLVCGGHVLQISDTAHQIINDGVYVNILRVIPHHSFHPR